MALTDKINAIANSIRYRTGKKDKMTLADMPKEINSIGTLLKPAEYPDYVRQEIIRVAEEVRLVLQDDSFVSICMSDTHYPGKENGEGIIHGMMAVKGLTQVLPVDFIAHLGDLSNEQERDTMSYIEDFHYEILSYIKEFGSNSIPLFVAIGNHDCGSYITSDNISDQFSGDWLYNYFTSLSNSSDTVFSGQSTGGYCYRDFPDKKIRVFLLNTSENIITGGNSNDSGTSETQRAWVASKLQELNNKTDAGDWGFIVLCHYPLDYGSSKTLSRLFEAYVGGTSIALNGTTYNFNGKNSAKFLVQFHGHIHNFLYDKIYGGATGNKLNGNPGTQYNVHRIGIPNGQQNRENYYYFTGSEADEELSDGTLWGIKFFQGNYKLGGEDEAQHKIPGTAKDTSLVVNVINPSEEKIYSFAYGAGYNRVVGIGDKEIYNANKFLKNITITDNGFFGIEKNGMYHGTVTIPENYELEISIVMNNTDITSDVFNNGIIQIEPVTGDITIKARSISFSHNLLPSSTSDYSGTIQLTGTDKNGNPTQGYLVDTRISTSSPLTTKNEPNYCTSGYIPIKPDSTIKIENVNIGNYDPKRYDGLFFYNGNDFLHQVSWISENPKLNLTNFVSGNTITYQVSNIEQRSVTCFRLVAKEITGDTIVKVNI